MLSKLFISFLGVVFILVVLLVGRIKFAEYQVRKLKKQSVHAQADYHKVREALELLELQRNPTKHEINNAYKRLMRAYHPDRGGSKFMAAKINVARDILLQQAA